MAFDILAAGMVTPVGFSWASSCAAIRAAIDRFEKTRFMFDGAWLRGAAVQFPNHLRGRAQLLEMAASAASECLLGAPRGMPRDTALALCLAEIERPGRQEGLDAEFLSELIAKLKDAERIGPSLLLTSGSIGAVEALEWTEQKLAARAASYGIVIGVDSFLHAPTLAAYHASRRLVTVRNADGFLPGEAAAAVLIGPSTSTPDALQCLGIGWGREPARQDSDIPLRGDGLAQAIRAALHASTCGYEDLDYRITDLNGEQFTFKEASLALARTMRIRKDFFDLWHPSDCVGRVGAASLPLILGVALAAARRKYAPGPGVLCHVGADDGRRAALVLRELGKPSHPSFL